MTRSSKLLAGTSLLASLLSLSPAEEEPEGPAAATAAPIDLEVVTYNIRYQNKRDEPTNQWANRLQLVIDSMREFDADIFGLQEALRGQLDDLAPALPGYSVFGVGRDDGRTRGEYSAILFRAGRFELDKTECGTFWLSDTPEKPGSMTWGNEIPRICTWARLTDRKSGRAFYVFNTHWDHRSQASRLRASKLVAQRIAQRKFPQEPVILMGDFNASKSNPAIRHLTSTGLRDTFAIAHPKAPDSRTAHGFNGGRDGSKIDHIFVADPSAVTAAAILHFSRDGRYPSDHYPVRAALQFR